MRWAWQHNAERTNDIEAVAAVVVHDCLSFHQHVPTLRRMHIVRRNAHVVCIGSTTSNLREAHFER